MEYERPKISEEEQKLLLKAVMRFFTNKRNNQISALAALMVENAILLKECNEHRERLGIELLPTYKP